MKKTVSLAEVASEPMASEEVEDSATEAYDAAVSELADTLGVPTAKMSKFRAALEAVIMTCPE